MPRFRSAPVLLTGVLSTILLFSGCAGKGELDDTGGLRITRSLCPAVAIPAFTGDIALFTPPESRDARALDVAATITNLRTTCDQAATPIRAATTFDVVARRAATAGARDVVLPYFATVMRAGNRIVSKQVGAVQVHFADGQSTGRGTAIAAAEIDRQAASLPASVSQQLNRKRKPTDSDAALDPMADPKVRSAVTQASFELLIGFQLTQSQLGYNATR